MKYILFFLFFICLGVNAQNAPQYTTDDVRILPTEIRWNYLTTNTYSVSLERLYSLHNDVIFHINTEGVASETLTTWFNPGDGSGFQAITPSDRDIQVVYPSLSANTSYTLLFELRSASGFVWGTRSHNFTIKGNSTTSNAGYTDPDEVWEIATTSSFSPPVAGAFPAGSPYNSNTVSGGHAYIKFAPGHQNKLIKPLIFVDGIDFNPLTYTYNGQVIRHGNTGWDVLMMGSDVLEPNPYHVDETGAPLPSEFNLYPSSLQTILGNGYDVVFVDFASGVDYVQKNGLVLVQLLQMVNARKASDGNSELPRCDNAVVGASMGGLVSKWALSYMEENNLNHECHTYVSFDSPQRGANIPIGIQAFSFLANQTGNDDANRWPSLNSPGARQMLINNLETASALDPLNEIAVTMDNWDMCEQYDPQSDLPVNYGFGQSASLRESFTTEMAALSYPQTTRNVAISCGSIDGVKNSIPDGGIYFEAYRAENPPDILCSQIGRVTSVKMATNNGNTLDIGDLLGFCVPTGIIDAGCKSIDLPALSYGLFHGFLPYGFNEINYRMVPSQFKRLQIYDYQDLLHLDNAPGCQRADLNLLKLELEKLGFEVPQNSNFTTFMPTMSTLDIQWPIDNEHLVKKINLLTTISDGLTPFAAIYGQEKIFATLN